MYSSILLSIKQEQFKRYSEAFNFFQSKSINMIIGGRKVDYVVHYRDLEILDDETEYFKRYYSTKETASRILKLINYYEANMNPPAPNLILLNAHQLLETRKRKHIKLIIMQEKSIARRAELEEEDEEAHSQHMILNQLNQSDFSQVSSEKEQNSDHNSYDSDPHCAYEEEDEGLRDTYSRSKTIDVFSFRDFPQADLIFDFKATLQEEPPKINVLPPPPAPPSPPPVITTSVAVQTLPIEFAVPVKEKEEKKSVLIPELKKEMSPELKKEMSPVPQMIVRSELKRENAVLTDSIEMVPRREEKEKGRGSTFMEYYNSQPVKAPSNLLQKFIKRKK